MLIKRIADLELVHASSNLPKNGLDKGAALKWHPTPKLITARASLPTIASATRKHRGLCTSAKIWIDL